MGMKIVCECGQEQKLDDNYYFLGENHIDVFKAGKKLYLICN